MYSVNTKKNDRGIHSLVICHFKCGNYKETEMKNPESVS